MLKKTIVSLTVLLALASTTQAATRNQVHPGRADVSRHDPGGIASMLYENCTLNGTLEGMPYCFGGNSGKGTRVSSPLQIRHYQ
jgi:hypothetical protein